MRYPKFRLTIGVGAALILAGPSAHGDFSGPYAPANWTLTNSNNGDGSATNDGATLVLTSADNNPGMMNNTDYTVASAAAGVFSFHWLYSTQDSCVFDLPYYLVNGTATPMMPGGCSPGLNGDVAVSVNAGDIIGFRMHSVDSQLGPGWITVTNFHGPIPGPAGAALLLLPRAVGPARRRS